MTGYKPLRIDFTNVMAEAIGSESGLTPDNILSFERSAELCAEDLARRRREDVGFPELPYDFDLVKRIKETAGKLRSWCKNFVVLGIGGSALGSRAVFSALNHPFHNVLPDDHTARGGSPRVCVVDNIDPVLISSLMDALGSGLPVTAFNVITKSGSTAETMAQFLYFRDALRTYPDCDPVRQIIVTTEPGRPPTDGPGRAKVGPLRKIADEEGYVTFPVPLNVGGRFSVLSAVGLLPAAVGGVDIEELLKGAAMMDKRCSSPELSSNPAAVYAALLCSSYQRGRPISVFMPYSHRLGSLADWYCQLWAESLGKRDGIERKGVFLGPTPVRAVGVTDQHSVMQLFQDGAYDKVITLVEVEQLRSEPLPVCSPENAGKGIEYLGRSSFDVLLASELNATRSALVTKRRPNLTIRIHSVRPHSLGQLFMLLEYAVVFAGHFFRVNPFDQPGVELGKQYTYGLLGREGWPAPAMPPSLDKYKV